MSGALGSRDTLLQLRSSQTLGAPRADVLSMPALALGAVIVGLNGQSDLRPVAHDFEGDCFVSICIANRFPEVTRVRDRLAGERDDDVARLELGPLARCVWLHGTNQQPFFDTEIFRELSLDRFHFRPKETVP